MKTKLILNINNGIIEEAIVYEKQSN